jgi:hypothetical protein
MQSVASRRCQDQGIAVFMPPFSDPRRMEAESLDEAHPLLASGGDIDATSAGRTLKSLGE